MRRGRSVYGGRVNFLYHWKTEVGNTFGPWMYNDDRVFFTPEKSLFAIADGDGPTYGGYYEPITIDLVWETISGIFNPEHALDSLTHGFQLAHEKSLAFIEPYPDPLSHTATAITVIHPVWPDLLIGHVGTCRAYLFRAGSLLQITEDHTVAAQIQRGEVSLPPGNPDISFYQGIATQLLGVATINPKFYALRLAADDRIFLCSDGVHRKVTDAEITAVLTEHTPEPERGLDLLVTLARERGSRSITTALIYPAR